MTEYAFPKELIDEINRRWSAVPARGGFELPQDHELRRLLEICYHASLRTAEHRLVHCAIAYAPSAQLRTEAMLFLQPPVALTDDEIVRLAPVADIRRTLIGCDRIDERLQIWGIFEQGHAWVQFSTGDPPDARVEEADVPPDCLTITIEQPGVLSVARGRHGLVRLRDGRVIVPQQNPLRDQSGPLGYFFRQLVEDLKLSAPQRDRLASDGSGGKELLLDIYTASIAAILERIRLRREGGSIVITRSTLDVATARITYTVAEHGGLAAELVNYCETMHNVLTTSSRSSSAGELERCRDEEALRRISQKLSRGISQISLLAGVDGAVLLDGDLQIQGFGTRFPVLLPIGATILDANTRTEHRCDKWGLRHQSVFSICLGCEQAVGLIVSQDGGVKAVKSVEGQLHLWDGILD